MRFPARSLDSRLDTAVILPYRQSKCTCGEARERVSWNPYLRTEGCRLHYKHTWTVEPLSATGPFPSTISKYFSPSAASESNHWNRKIQTNLFHWNCFLSNSETTYKVIVTIPILLDVILMCFPTIFNLNQFISVWQYSPLYILSGAASRCDCSILLLPLLPKKLEENYQKAKGRWTKFHVMSGKKSF